MRSLMVDCFCVSRGVLGQKRHPLASAQLHVFARTARHLDFCKVEVPDGLEGPDAGDLKKAAMAELKLGVAPDRVRLFHEVKGGGILPKPLDSCEKLALQGVTEGSRVLVEVMAPAALLLPPPLPPPLEFSVEVLGGERTVVANLQGGPGFPAPHPFFMSLAQFTALEHFLKRGPPFSMPAMLMITGTIKSGKSRIVQSIIPRLLALYYAQAPPSTRRRPVIFHHVFTHGVSGASAAELWLASLLDFSQSLGIPLVSPLGHGAVQAVPKVAQALARRIYEEGGKLWLLFDELGAPVVASQPAEAASFVQLFTDTLSVTSPYARTVAFGSGRGASQIYGACDGVCTVASAQLLREHDSG
jgi:hypothetical protein